MGSREPELGATGGHGASKLGGEIGGARVAVGAGYRT